MTRPAFSIIIPTFNRERTIERAIESVFAQRHPPAEIILADDASDDDTVALVRRRFPEIRVLALESNRGPAVARNAAIEVATQDHLAFLDSDDAWHEDYLAAISEAWLANPEASIVYTQYDKIDDRPGGRTDPMNVTVDGDQIEAMLRNNFIHSSSLMSTRRDWTVAVGGFDPAYRIGEDRAMYLRLLLRGPAVAVPRRLVRRYVGDDNLINDLERWWLDATAIVARFVAQPDFAAYRWVEDQSRARVWEAIRWHDRQRRRTRQRSTSVELSALGAEREHQRPPDIRAAYLFVHAGGLPIRALSTLLGETSAFGWPRPWFDHDNLMLDEAAARHASDFSGFIEALRTEAMSVGQPWSALVSDRDLAWLDKKPAFRHLLGETSLDVIRIRSRDPVLQACRLAAAGCPGGEAGDIAHTAIAKAIVALEQAETSLERWLQDRRLKASPLWLEDLHAHDLATLRALVADLAPSTILTDCQPLDPPSDAELAMAKDFREEAARRHWSHALRSPSPLGNGSTPPPGPRPSENAADASPKIRRIS